ncbi:AAA family ATPase [Micromonospora sp. FIMYZ51]|uniref:ATP-dependent nuclease n=1 Tax=Micromonospora sp. FIMYZ51 TaxID=3051832 RepID=UPI00311DB787
MSGSFDDKRRAISRMFSGDNQYRNFGAVLTSLEIRGFRGVADLTLSLKSPVTALSGLNGTGKSTIAQLATCAYRRPPGRWRYYVKDYFPVSALDPKPFADDAHAIYSYSDPKGVGARQVTVSRAKVEWSGYKRQPERSSYYIGLNWFIPKVERRDFSVYAARSLTVGAVVPLSSEAMRHIGRILGISYTELNFAEVIHGPRTARLATADAGGRRYSENHMGFGEARVLYMVSEMENAPQRSLFVLEEPETALHGDAQRRLARYLVDVSYRRRHQIILTTHSSAILGELHRESVVYLGRSPDGFLTATTGLSTYQVDSYLSERHHGRPTVCVEDDFAACLTTEIVRLCDPHLLAGLNYLKIGGGQQIPSAVRVLRQARARTVGICDGDMPERIYSAEGMFRLPGVRPPEEEVFLDSAVVAYFRKHPYLIDLPDLLATADGHHYFPDVVAAKVAVSKAVVVAEACRAYVSARQPADFKAFIEFLHRELQDHH